MIDAAEALYGPYRWGRYDLLVLPPRFPFGGMENPTLTFATPTILAGDRSLVSLVAHELAHSWCGNLVTNATWSDFWLNEGFTVYFENRIMEAVYGAERAEMLRQLGRADLTAELETLPEADQKLRVDLDGRDPDDGFTSVPYDKGAAFLFTIESVVGPCAPRRVPARLLRPQRLRPDDERGPRSPRWTRTCGTATPRRARQFAPKSGSTSRACRITCRRCSRPRWPARARPRRSSPRGTMPMSLNTFDWATPQWIAFLQALPETLPECAPRGAGPPLPPVGDWKQRGPVRVAARRDPQRLRSGVPGARSVPDAPGAAQVCASAVPRLRRGRPAARRAHLRPGAARLPLGHDAVA